MSRKKYIRILKFSLLTLTGVTASANATIQEDWVTGASAGVVCPQIGDIFKMYVAMYHVHRRSPAQLHEIRERTQSPRTLDALQREMIRDITSDRPINNMSIIQYGLEEGSKGWIMECYQTNGYKGRR